jgi:hypothetical protein
MTKAVPEEIFIAMARTTTKDGPYGTAPLSPPLHKIVPFKCVQNTMKSSRYRSLTSTRRTKSVRFAPTKTVAKVYRSKEDAVQSWYHSSEYSAFDQERKRTVAALHEVHGNLTSLDPTVFTVTGLEHHLCRQQMIERRKKTYTHVRSVLRQQESNRSRGIDDPESLRYISELFSVQPSKRAHLRGVLDFTLNSMLR